MVFADGIHWLPHRETSVKTVIYVHLGLFSSEEVY